MKTLLAIVGDCTAAPLLETALLVARRFGARIIGLNALTGSIVVHVEPDAITRGT